MPESLKAGWSNSDFKEYYDDCPVYYNPRKRGYTHDEAQTEHMRRDKLRQIANLLGVNIYTVLCYLDGRKKVPRNHAQLVWLEGNFYRKNVMIHMENEITLLSSAYKTQKDLCEDLKLTNNRLNTEIAELKKQISEQSEPSESIAANDSYFSAEGSSLKAAAGITNFPAVRQNSTISGKSSKWFNQPDFSYLRLYGS